MKIIIKEWPNRTATLMTTNGQVIWTFSSIDEARMACREWQAISSAEEILHPANHTHSLVPDPAIA